MEVGQTVSVKKLTANSETSWQADGAVKLIRCLHGRCCNCGMVLDAIKQEVPVQFIGILCRKCKKADHLDCETQMIELEAGTYKFSAVLTCSRCAKVSKVWKLLKKLWSVTSLKVSITGIEVAFDKKAS
jgi:hypothetical protein